MIRRFLAWIKQKPTIRCNRCGCKLDNHLYRAGSDLVCWICYDEHSMQLFVEDDIRAKTLIEYQKRQH